MDGPEGSVYGLVTHDGTDGRTGELAGPRQKTGRQVKNRMAAKACNPANAPIQTRR
jgi:hypothetical protein